MRKKKSKTAATAPKQGVVVFGQDDANKPRAAYFEARQADFAVKAADSLGYQVLRTWDTEQAELISSLPAGRVYASGQGIVPAVRRKLFKKIAELAAATGGTEDRTKAESFGPQPADLGAAALSNSPDNPVSGPKAAGPAYGLPRHWDEIDMGHLVIAPDDEPDEDGWFAANVVGKDGDMFTLQWAQWPRYRKIRRHRYNLALMYPGTLGAGFEVRAPQTSATAPESHYPDSWAEISVGSLVLAKEDGPWQAWWEAIAFEVDGQALTLRWRDHQEIPTIIRPRLSLGLLYPNPH